MSNQTDLNRFIACRFNVLCHSFAFEVYDVNRDGYISNGDLFSVMQAMVGDNLTEEQLQQLVDREMRDLDKDKDGLISFEEFKEGVKDLDVRRERSAPARPATGGLSGEPFRYSFFSAISNIKSFLYYLSNFF